MDRKSKALAIVAWLLVIEGALAILRGLTDFSWSGFSVDVSMLALPVGIGLLWGSGWWRGANFWRAAALFVVGLQLFLLAMIPVVLFVRPAGMKPFLMLSPAGGPFIFVVAIILAVVAFKIWQFRVVYRS